MLFLLCGLDSISSSCELSHSNSLKKNKENRISPQTLIYLIQIISINIAINNSTSYDSHKYKCVG